MARVTLTAADEPTFEKVRAHLSESPPADAEVLPSDEPLSVVLRLPGIPSEDIARPAGRADCRSPSRRFELPPLARKVGGEQWPRAASVDFLLTYALPFAQKPMEPAGIEPVTSCLQSAWDEAQRGAETCHENRRFCRSVHPTVNARIRANPALRVIGW